LEAGIDNFSLVDTAGGFSGTWYWNRHPGLMCDVESYIYIPLLEEMNYMPRQKYSKGYGVRQYAESLTMHDLPEKSILQTKVEKIPSIEEGGEWEVVLSPVNGQNRQPFKIGS
jgi:cation diffusion facilitator CzcD-associated flavoprotein CzcO